MVLTVAEVSERAAVILDRRTDYVKASQLELALYVDVLRGVADGTCEDPVQCAKVAVTTSEIEFGL